MKKYLFLGFTLLTNLTFGQGELSDTTKELIILNICESLKDNYVFPEIAKTLSDSIKSYNQNGKYASVKDYNEFASILTKDIRKINNDKHIRILYDLDLENEIIKFISSSKEAKIVSEIEISKEKSKNFHFKKIEVLPSNIGYIELNGFALPSKYTSNTIFSAMCFVANTNAVILDLRNNFGGNSDVANEILSYFFSENQFLGRTYNRIEDKWTNQYVRKRSKFEKDIFLNMPVYILTSNRTFSAAEGLSYNNLEMP